MRSESLVRPSCPASRNSSGSRSRYASNGVSAWSRVSVTSNVCRGSAAGAPAHGGGTRIICDARMRCFFAALSARRRACLSCSTSAPPRGGCALAAGPACASSAVAARERGLSPYSRASLANARPSGRIGASPPPVDGAVAAAAPLPSATVRRSCLDTLGSNSSRRLPVAAPQSPAGSANAADARALSPVLRVSFPCTPLSARAAAAAAAAAACAARPRRKPPVSRT
mmetsp:Transcript_28870/g.85476  ORF Transcript_28870/g.85476 Transcript_28870/m.85476 type:complete len:227 (-) Transcript_28870:569-1249(-)